MSDQFNIVATVAVPKQRVQDLLVGWFENGYSSWTRKIGEYKLPEGLSRDDFKEGGKMQGESYFHPSQIVPVTEGCTLILVVDDPDGDDDGSAIEFPLNLETIQKGLQVMAEKYPSHFADILAENDDANTADIFGQCVVYGEEIFS
jgi:hypothetical protein